MAEPQRESWLKPAALTVIILAVASGIAALKALDYATRVQMDTARECRLWRDYQVESIKKDNYGMSRDLLAALKLMEGKTAKAPKSLADKIREYENEMGRLNQEKDRIKAAALNLGTQEETFAKKAGKLGLAVILLQLAIMTCATGALIRKKILWLAGLGLGGWGLVYLGLGLL